MICFSFFLFTSTGKHIHQKDRREHELRFSRNLQNWDPFPLNRDNDSPLHLSTKKLFRVGRTSFWHGSRRDFPCDKPRCFGVSAAGLVNCSNLNNKFLCNRFLVRNTFHLSCRSEQMNPCRLRISLRWVMSRRFFEDEPNGSDVLHCPFDCFVSDTGRWRFLVIPVWVEALDCHSAWRSNDAWKWNVWTHTTGDATIDSCSGSSKCPDYSCSYFDWLIKKNNFGRLWFTFCSNPFSIGTMRSSFWDGATHCNK